MNNTIDNHNDYATHHNTWIERSVTFGARHPWITLTILLLCSLLSLLALPKLKLDTSTNSMLNVNNPMLLVYKKVIDEFGSDNITLIHLQHPDLFSKKKLTALQDATYRLQDIKAVAQVESLFTALSIRDSEWGLEINPLINYIPETEEALAAIKDNALYSPLLRNNQLSKDGQTTAIMLTLHDGFRDPEISQEIYEQIEQAIAPLRNEFNHVFQVGTPRIDHDFATGIFADMPRMAPFGFGALIICILIMLRTWVGVILPLLTASISILWAAGLIAYFNIPVNLLINIIPTLVIVVGSTEDTHMLSTYLQGLDSKHSNPRFPAIRFMAIHVGLPIFVTSFTTFVGFLSNALSDIELIRHFGIASAIAMFTNLVTTVLIIPMLLRFIGPTSSPLQLQNQSKHWSQRLVKHINYLTSEHSRSIITITVILCLIAATLVPQIRVNNDPLSFFKDSNPIIHDSQTLQKNLAGMQVLFLTLHAPLNLNFKQPDILEQLDNTQRFLKQQLHYDYITSISDYLKLVNREMHQSKPAYYQLPEEKNLIEQYLMLFQRHDLEGVLSSDAQRANIIIRHHISDSSQLKNYLAQLEQYLQGNLDSRMHYSITSKNLLINQAADDLFINQQQSLLGLIFVVCLLISLLYSSVTAGLIALIPNLIPILFMFALMSLLNIPINPATALVSVIAIGIAIDDTIHMLNTYNKECRVDGNQEAAMCRTLESEALPIISTSIALSAGFCSHFLSNFHIITQFGLLCAFTLLIAMLTDLLLTPILFKHVRIVNLIDMLEFKLGEELFNQCQIFTDMTRFEVKRVILLSQVTVYQPGETVIQQGDIGNQMFVILKGIVDISIEKKYHEKYITSLSWGDVFGETSYAGNGKRFANVRVTLDSEPLQVLVLSQENIKNSLRFHPRLHAKLNYNISALLAQRLMSKHA